MAMPRRRLERSNATRNSTYSAPGDRDDDGLEWEGGGGGCDYSSQTSFRIRGGRGAEIAFLCRKLGLSGPEDLAIPPAVYAAAMSHSPHSRLARAPARGPQPREPAGVASDGGSRPHHAEEAVDEAGEPHQPEAAAGAGEERSELQHTEEEASGEGGGPRQPEAAAGAGDEGSGPHHMAGQPDSDEEEEADAVEELGKENDEGVVVEARPEEAGAVPVAIAAEESSSGQGIAPSRMGEEVAIAPSPMGPSRRVIRSWIKGGRLGSGSFGTVYEAISGDGFFFAVKEVSLIDQGINASQRIFQLEQEISLLSRLQHENIVQYLGTDKEDSKLYIFLELATQGSLAALYQKYHLQDSQVSAYTRQILNGLNYLHQRNVVHRDIKCANILVGSNGLVKLADFGLAKEMSILNQVKSCKGTVYWMAPEVAKTRPYGPPADIWSLGCTVLEMLTRRLPYPDKEWTQTLFKIGRGITPPIPNTLSKDARDFITKCVQVKPADRPSAAQLLKHPFVNRTLPHHDG